MDKKKITLIIEIVLFVGAMCAITGFYYFGSSKPKDKETYQSVGIIKVNDENYEEEVLKSEKPVILEFSSNSCPPCLTMIPTMINIAKNHQDIKVCEVNVSEEKAKEVTKKYNIEAYPTIYIIKNGEVTKTFVGATNEETILKEIK